MALNLTMQQKAEIDALGKLWNNHVLTRLKTKKKMLSDAGHMPNAFAYRAWEGIPLSIKLDLLYVHQRDNRKG